MKKSVLFVIDSLKCGGAEKSLASLMQLLNPEKYEIHLWILHRGGVFESLIPSSVIIEPNPTYSWNEKLLMRIGGLFNSISYRFNRLIRRKKHGAEILWKSSGFAYKVPEGYYDVAVAYQQGFPTYLVASKVKSRIKVAWINVNIFSAGYNKQFNTSFYNRMDRIVTVSSELDKIVRDGLPQFTSKYQVIYDILNPSLIRKMSEEKLDIVHDSSAIIVTVGRLAYQKGYDLAVLAARILKDQGIDFRWIFVGEGPERKAIETLIQQNGVQSQVILAGLQFNPYPFMKRATVYVQTSRFEGFGLTIGEAKILHKPIVSTNFDVVHNQITDGINGLIVDKTPESIAGGVSRLLSNRELKERLINNLEIEINTTASTEVAKVEKLFDED